MQAISIRVDTPAQKNLIRDVLDIIRNESPRKITRGEAIVHLSKFYLQAKTNPTPRTKELTRRFEAEELIKQENNLRKKIMENLDQELEGKMAYTLEEITKSNDDMVKKIENEMNLVQHFLKQNNETKKKVFSKFTETLKQLLEF